MRRSEATGSTDEKDRNSRQMEKSEFCAQHISIRRSPPCVGVLTFRTESLSSSTASLLTSCSSSSKTPTTILTLQMSCLRCQSCVDQDIAELTAMGSDSSRAMSTEYAISARAPKPTAPLGLSVRKALDSNRSSRLPSRCGSAQTRIPSNLTVMRNQGWLPLCRQNFQVMSLRPRPSQVLQRPYQVPMLAHNSFSS